MVCSPDESLASSWRRELPNAEVIAKKAAAAAVRAGGGALPVTVMLAGDEQTRALNRRFRKLDKATDVLSFPSTGDIAVSLQALLRQAEEDNLLAEAYLGWLVIHGVLHLCGFDHRTAAEAAAMHALEKRLMAENFGCEPPL